jgi:cephalosporin hydroxylase
VIEAVGKYIADRNKQVRINMENRDLGIAAHRFTEAATMSNYVKGFTWMGVPVIQYPSDMMVLQELIWQVKPNTIIECGVAFGGLTVFMASVVQNWGGGVVGVDIDIRPHTREIIRKGGFNNDIILIEGDSSALYTFDEVRKVTEPPTMVVLDSNHTHDHVLHELMMYGQLVGVGSYMVVFDSSLEQFAHLETADRPWGRGNNPYTAVQEWLKTELGSKFEVDREVEQRALITSAKGGWLKRVRE